MRAQTHWRRLNARAVYHGFQKRHYPSPLGKYVSLCGVAGLDLLRHGHEPLEGKGGVPRPAERCALCDAKYKEVTP